MTLFQNKNYLEAVRTGYKNSKVIVIASQKSVLKISDQPLLKPQSVDNKFKQDFSLEAIKRNINVLKNAPANLKQDRDFFLKIIGHDIDVLKYASDDLKQDREFFLKAVRHDINVLKHASNELKQDREFFLKAISHDIDALSYASDDLKQDREFFLKAIKSDIYVLTYASDNLRQDREFFLKAIRHDISVLSYTCDDLLQDKEFFLEAIRCDILVLSYASKDLLQDREFFLKVISHNIDALTYASEILKQDRKFFLKAIKYNVNILAYAPDRLKQNKEFFLEAIEQCDISVLKYMDNRLKKDKRFALLAVKQNGLALQYMTYSLQADKKVALAAVRQNDLALNYVSPDLEKDDEIILEVIKKNGLDKIYEDVEQKKAVALKAVKRIGLILQYLPNELQNDKEVVLAAVIQNGSALAHASKELKNNKEIFLTAVKQIELAFLYASHELKHDKETVFLAIAQNRAVLSYVSDDLQQDKEFILRTVRQDGLALMHATFKENTTIEAAHYSISQKLQLWLEDPQQKEALFKYASTILDNQETLFLHDEHPVLQKAIDAYCLTSQSLDSKCPYQIHLTLQKAISEETLVPDFAGYRKRANKKGFTFADIPNGIIPLQTLFETIEQKGVNAKEVAELCCGSTMSEIKANVLQDGTVIATLLAQKGEKGDPLPLTAMYLYAILKQISDADDIRQGKCLSQREIQLLKFCSMVKECSTGQRDAIEQYYINTIGRGSLNSNQNKIEMAIDQAIQVALKSVLASDALSVELNCGRAQQAHTILYLQNRFHRQIGLVHTLSFDRHAGALNGDLIKKNSDKVLEAIKRHLHPIDSVKQALDQFLHKKEITYMEFVTYFQKECGLDKYEAYIEFDEDTNPIGITSFAVEKALKKLEYIT